MLKLIVTEKFYPKNYPYNDFLEESDKFVLSSIDIKSNTEFPIVGHSGKYFLNNDVSLKFYSVSSDLEISPTEKIKLKNELFDIYSLYDIINYSPELYRKRFKNLEPGSYLLETRYIGDDAEAEIQIVGMKKEINK